MTELERHAHAFDQEVKLGDVVLERRCLCGLSWADVMRQGRPSTSVRSTAVGLLDVWYVPLSILEGGKVDAIIDDTIRDRHGEPE